jgi:hypothetical protein
MATLRPLTNRRTVKLGSTILVLTSMLALVTSGTHAGQLSATGQTTPYQAITNDGDAIPDNVPDDGTLQFGTSLRYRVLNDGTVKDLNTGLIWEVKCAPGCGGLHDVGNTSYRWSGIDGTQATIWDWLDAVNAEGGQGYAGHNDWRIANIRELQSLVDYGLFDPAVDPVLGPVALTRHWSSTSVARSGPQGDAWVVDLSNGDTTAHGKLNLNFVRAVRGGRE